MSTRPLKNGLKRAIQLGAEAVSLIRPARQGGRILTYHSVGSRIHETNVTPSAFREQMTWLAENAEVKPLSAIVAGESGVALTFDDGYRDNLTEAAQILEDLKIPVVLFVVTCKAGDRFQHDGSDPAAELLTWEDLRLLKEMGWEFGGHSRTHPRLATLTPEQQREEIAGSREDLRDNLGMAPVAFAYPYGTCLDFNGTSISEARHAGYSCALTNCFGVVRMDANPFTLPRINIDGSDTLDSFRKKVTGRFDALEFLETSSVVRTRRVLNRVLGQ